MTESQINRALAMVAEGVGVLSTRFDWHANMDVPIKWTEDLNAVAWLVSKLLFSQRRAYRIALWEISTTQDGHNLAIEELIDATALQRCRALVKVLGIEKE